MVAQLVRSNMRDDADWMRWDLCPRRSPATTTARTPDGWVSRPGRWISSAGRYASHGVSSENATSVRVSSMRRRILPTTSATSTPTTTPPTADTMNPSPTSHTVIVPPAAAMDTRSATIAVASLTRLSPSRIVTMRRGRPTRRAIVVAATASGGATTAPNANAGAHSIGNTACSSTATPAVVNSTSPTLSRAIGRRFARKSTSDVRIAAA